MWIIYRILRSLYVFRHPVAVSVYSGGQSTTISGAHNMLVPDYCVIKIIGLIQKPLLCSICTICHVNHVPG